jgi:adenosine deaminase
MSVMYMAIPLKRDLIGVGLDSDELHNPTDKFRALFAKCRAASLHLTMHGDVHHVDVDEHIR